MKFSKFNILWEENGNYYCSNSFSKTMIKLDKQHYEILLSKDDNRLNEIADDIPILHKEGIVVDDEINEINMLRFSREKSKASSDEIEIVVAPTLACNFKCVYCFEEQRTGLMSLETQDRLVNYIKNKIECLKIKKIRFIWFGGEPLLCVDIIENVSRRLNTICEQSNTDIEYSVISNGYLLTSSILDSLESVNIHHMQITLDGLKETHDKRRVLQNGGGTFDNIVNNLQLFAGRSFTVAIRVNIDKDNVGSFALIKSSIDELDNKNIVCHPALVEKTANQTDNQKNKCLLGNEEWFYNDETIKKYYLHNAKEYLDNICCVCSAEHHNSFVVDELGNLYKCWNSIGYDNEIWGSIYDEGESKGNPLVASRYLGRDPYTEKACMDCEYIPICAGGCIYHSVYSQCPKCTPAKFLYAELIKKQDGGDKDGSN